MINFIDINEKTEYLFYLIRNQKTKYVEIWNLSVPKNFFNTTSIEEVYREICQQKNLKYGI